MLIQDREGQKKAVEDFLNTFNVKYTYHEMLPLEDIDLAGSLHNQARQTPLDQEYVESLRAAIKNGQALPPGIVYFDTARRRYLILGGNHRTDAYLKEHKTTAPFYIVETEPEVREMIKVVDNSFHGLNMTYDEKIAHGIALHDKGNISFKSAANAVGLTESVLKKQWELRNVDVRALELNIPTGRWTRLLPTARTRFWAIKSDDVFLAAADLAIDARFGVGEVREFITALNQLPTIDASLAFITAERERLREVISKVAIGMDKKKIKRAFPPVSQLKLAGKAIVRLNAKTLADSVLEQGAETQQECIDLLNSMGNLAFAAMAIVREGQTIDLTKGKTKPAHSSTTVGG